MRIAIPVTNGRVSAHFGHCEQFEIFDVDTDKKIIEEQQLLIPPAHAPGILPQWLSGLNVEIIIAAGIGRRAQQLFAQNNINVIVGATDNTPQQLVQQYLTGQLQTGQNICDH